MDKTKKKYKKPLVEIRLITVENGFGTSSIIESFEEGDEINW